MKKLLVLLSLAVLPLTTYAAPPAGRVGPFRNAYGFTQETLMRLGLEQGEAQMWHSIAASLEKRVARTFSEIYGTALDNYGTTVADLARELRVPAENTFYREFAKPFDRNWYYNNLECKGIWNSAYGNYLINANAASRYIEKAASRLKLDEPVENRANVDMSSRELKWLLEEGENVQHGLRYFIGTSMSTVDPVLMVEDKQLTEIRRALSEMMGTSSRPFPLSSDPSKIPAEINERITKGLDY
ncbi:MAG: hypothetical protein J5601_00170 [Elusimicrobiaceae bacterium]|nr:hypothetical protein [Elusimicrobiaceae bacterium]